MSDVETDSPDPIDVTGARAAVDAHRAAFNAKDADATAAAFTEDGWAVAVDGTRLRGRPALLAAHRASYAGALREQYADHEVVEMATVDAHTAVAQVRVTAVDEHGAPLDVGHAMTALYVLVRRDGRWLVAAVAHTLVADDG